jgi:histone H3/H4
VQKSAFDLLQSHAETMLASRFADALVAARHAKRVTVTKYDVS